MCRNKLANTFPIFFGQLAREESRPLERDVTNLKHTIAAVSLAMLFHVYHKRLSEKISYRDTREDCMRTTYRSSSYFIDSSNCSGNLTLNNYRRVALKGATEKVIRKVMGNFSAIDGNPDDEFCVLFSIVISPAYYHQIKLHHV